MIDIIEKIVIKQLCFSFDALPVFERFSLELEAADTPVLALGPSGCGKTTLLRLMAGLLAPRSGVIDYASGGAAFTPNISFAFQEPRLFPRLTVLENVALPLEAASISKTDAAKRAAYFLSMVALSDKAGAFPHALSGGEAQRVSIARAFAYPAPLLLMDEPFQSLDIPLRVELMTLIQQLLAVEPRFLIAVTHDPREAIFLGKRVIALGKAPRGVMFDAAIHLAQDERVYGASAPAAHALERKLLTALGSS
ncbi:MAG: ABC transporter ATP-binding protein [Treponema sp.]|jgi:NitT/TauT family transport system ATP-binding protein|nr:ABC transporter ATP-binding protein [Treponema sp.]